MFGLYRFLSIHINHSYGVVAVSPFLHHHVLGLILLDLISLVHGLQGFAAVLHEVHEVLAHVVGFVDAVVPGAVLTETEEDRIYSHLINTDEGMGYQVGKQHRHEYLGPKILNLFVVLE